MNKTVAKEKLEYYKGFKNNLWIMFIAATGSVATLLINLDTIIKQILFFTGFIFDTTIFIGIIICILKIRYYIYKLGE